MARIWNVRLNVDALNAAVAGLECDADRLAFFAGFHGGLNGKQKADKGEPWIAGWAVANECLAEAVAFSEKQRAKVNKRYHGTTVVEPRNYHGTTVVLPIQQSTIYNLQSTNDKPKDTLAQPTVERAPVALDLFPEFWSLYDKSKGKDRAAKKWSHLPMKVRKQIMEALPAYVQSTPDKQFRKDPTTWLNQRCWDDEIIERGAHAIPQQDNGPEAVYDQAAVAAVTTPEDIKRAWDNAVRLGCAVLP